MTTYRAALTHNVVLGSLVVIEPQPRTVGYQHGRRSFAASGIVVDELPHVELQWDMIETVAQYQALLAQFGLTTASTANVSVYVQDERYNWIIRNAVAVLPQIGTDGERSNYFFRNFVIILKDIRVQP